jgi:hypothetical protein
MMKTEALQALTDAELLYHAMASDTALSDWSGEPFDPAKVDHEAEAAKQATAEQATDEMDRRFGEGASDRTADWFTAMKASPEDILEWAKERPEQLAEIARGHDCDNRSVNQGTGRCWCGRAWAKMANRNSWYDPTEGPDPSTSSDDGQGEASAGLIEVLSDAEARAEMAWADRQFYGHA